MLMICLLSPSISATSPASRSVTEKRLSRLYWFIFFVGRFWGQPEFGRTDVTKISAESLASIFRALGPGVSEISCHPGRMESRPDAWYNREREVELQSLCDAKVKAAIAAEGIRLISFREYRHVASTTARHMLASGCRPTASSH